MVIEETKPAEAGDLKGGKDNIIETNEGKTTTQKRGENPKEGKQIQHEYCFMGFDAVQSGEYLMTLTSKPSKQSSKQSLLCLETSVNFYHTTCICCHTSLTVVGNPDPTEYK